MFQTIDRLFAHVRVCVRITEIYLFHSARSHDGAYTRAYLCLEGGEKSNLARAEAAATALETLALPRFLRPCVTEEITLGYFCVAGYRSQPAVAISPLPLPREANVERKNGRSIGRTDRHGRSAMEETVRMQAERRSVLSRERVCSNPMIYGRIYARATRPRSAFANGRHTHAHVHARALCSNLYLIIGEGVSWLDRIVFALTRKPDDGSIRRVAADALLFFFSLFALFFYLIFRRSYTKGKKIAPTIGEKTLIPSPPRVFDRKRTTAQRTYAATYLHIFLDDDSLYRPSD